MYEIFMKGEFIMYNKTTNEVILYGIDNISEKLDGIIHSLNLEKQCFEIKLIMSEAIANAFIHGNNQDKDKQGEHHYANQKLQSSNSERRNCLVDTQRVLGNHQQSRGNRSVQGTRSCIPEQTLLGHAEGTSVRQFDAHHQTSRGNKLRQC